jgi:phage terminase large subunit GpA-like protein
VCSSDLAPQGKERDPSAYGLFAPCCGSEITDAQRLSMCRDVRQETTLSSEDAAKRPWVGVHFSQLYMANKPLAFLAEKWIETLDDEGAKRVFVNKRLGDVYEPKVRETKPEEWSRCIVVPRGPDDREAYTRGHVPPGVRFLTAGQDSRTVELHWCVWGWGLVRNKDGFPELAGWLIDYGVVKREHTPTIEAADLAICDQLLYSRAFPRTDGSGSLYVTQGYHDSGWCPVAVYEYCRRRPGQSIPCKGDSDDDGASSAPVVRWGSSPTWRGPDGREVQDASMRLAILNTFTLKTQLFGMLPRRIEREDGTVQTQLTLPRDVGDEWIGVVTQGDDYHEFTRQSAMEAAMAIRNFCRQNGLRISEITFTARNGATTENQAGE